MASLTVMKGVAFTRKRLLQWLEEDGKVVLQTKRDEIRCMVKVEDTGITFTSASGKPLYNIGEPFANLFAMLNELTGLTRFDCGASVNNSFDLTRRVLTASKKVYDCRGREHYILTEKRRGEPTRTVYEGTLTLAFWLYDLPELSDKPYEERRVQMIELARMAGNSVFCPETEIVTDEQEVYAINDMLVQAGHEGTMIKRFDHRYTEGRTVDWMKLKPEEEVDVEIIGYTPGEDGFAGMVGSLIGRAEDGSTVNFSGFTLELRRELTDNFEAYRGRWAEVRYMQRDSQNGYRHPRFYRWHADK